MLRIFAVCRFCVIIRKFLLVLEWSNHPGDTRSISWCGGFWVHRHRLTPSPRVPRLCMRHSLPFFQWFAEKFGFPTFSEKLWVWELTYISLEWGYKYWSYSASRRCWCGHCPFGFCTLSITSYSRAVKGCLSSRLHCGADYLQFCQLTLWSYFTSS